MIHLTTITVVTLSRTRDARTTWHDAGLSLGADSAGTPAHVEVGGFSHCIGSENIEIQSSTRKLYALYRPLPLIPCTYRYLRCISSRGIKVVVRDGTMTMLLSSSHSDDFCPLLIIKILRSSPKSGEIAVFLCETTSKLPTFESRKSDCVQRKPLIRMVDEW